MEYSMKSVTNTLTKIFGLSSHRPYGAAGEEAHENFSPPGKGRQVLSALQSRGKARSAARPANYARLNRGSSQDAFPQRQSAIGGANIAPAFPPSTSSADETASIGGDAYIDEQLAQAMDKLVRQGLLPPAQRATVGQLSSEHQAYLCSDEGLAALRQAGKSGRQIDLQKFAKIPAQLLVPHPQFPSPLFRLATPEGVQKLGGDEEYRKALENGTQCNIFDLKQEAGDGRNPIHIAALYGNLPATRAFVSFDKQTHEYPKERALNAINGNHQSPLEVAVDSRMPHAAQVADILIAGDANLTPKRAKHGLLQEAVRSGDPALVEVVVNASREHRIPYRKDKSGDTPLAALRETARGAKEGSDQQKATKQIEAILESYKGTNNQPQVSSETTAPTAEWAPVKLED
jgi:hypothetical protein